MFRHEIDEKLGKLVLNFLYKFRGSNIRLKLMDFAKQTQDIVKLQLTGSRSEFAMKMTVHFLMKLPSFYRIPTNVAGVCK